MMAQQVELISSMSNMERTAEHLGKRRATKATELQQLFILSLDGGWPVVPDTPGAADLDGAQGKRAFPVFLRIKNAGGIVRDAPDLATCNILLSTALGPGALQMTSLRERLVATLDARLLAFLPTEVQARLKDSGGNWKSVVWVPESAWRTLCAALSYDKEVLLSYGRAMAEHTLDKAAVAKAHETTLTWVKPLDTGNDPDKAAQTFAHLVVGMCAEGMGYQENPMILGFAMGPFAHQHPVVWILKKIWDLQIFSWETLVTGRNGQEEVELVKTTYLLGPMRDRADDFALEKLQLAFEEERLEHKVVSQAFEPEGRVGIGNHLPPAQRAALRQQWWEKADEVKVKELERAELLDTLSRQDVTKAVQDGLFGYEPHWPHPYKCLEVLGWLRRADEHQADLLEEGLVDMPSQVLPKKVHRWQYFVGEAWRKYFAGAVGREGRDAAISRFNKLSFDRLTADMADVADTGVLLEIVWGAAIAAVFAKVGCLALAFPGFLIGWILAGKVIRKRLLFISGRTTADGSERKFAYRRVLGIAFVLFGVVILVWALAFNLWPLGELVPGLAHLKGGGGIPTQDDIDRLPAGVRERFRKLIPTPAP